MYRDKQRYGQDPTRITRSQAATFQAPIKWQHEVEHGTRQGHHRLVFTCSWSDFFLEDADAWRPEAWDIIKHTPDLIFQVLTKRPERIRASLPADWGDGYPNVWLGVSVENRRWLPRLTWLGDVPAVVKFVSLEPLLGPVHDLTYHLVTPGGHTRLLDWVIVGGESGPRHRPMQPAWLAHVVNACAATQTPLWVKQASALREGQQGAIPDAVWAIKHLPHVEPRRRRTEPAGQRSLLPDVPLAGVPC